MWFWWFMFVCNMLYSLTMILAGWYMWKHYPKEINSVAGYRSGRSQMNMDTWKFANENCGTRWWKIGWIMLVPTIIVQIPFYGKSDDAIGWIGLAICIIECTILVISTIPTEKALKNQFNEDGSRKK
ncbi:MAG: SdpI family protein [Lachnospiraceae bacterium]|nr:SdpI family protein [Lachnospiraceae bacterium]